MILNRNVFSVKKCCRIPLAFLMAISVMILPAAASRVPNADVEIDADMDGNPDDWFFGANTAYIDNDDSDGVGTRSLEFTGVNTDWRSSEFGVTAGETLTWSLDYKFLSSASGQIRADLRFFEGPGNFNFQGEQAILIDASNPDSWQTLGPMDFVVPGVATVADVRVSSFFGSGLSGSVRLDNFQVVPEPSSLSLWVLAGLCGTRWLRRTSRRAGF